MSQAKRSELTAWDNAMAESFFASLKGQLIDAWAWPTPAATRRAIVEYIAWYKGTRLHSTLGIAAQSNSKTTTTTRSGK